MSDFAVQRRQMVERLAERRGITSKEVLRVLGEVPRHLFVKDHLRHKAYSDHALPLVASQTISQPWVVARMTELLEVDKRHTVLEIGTGSGYQTAVLAHLARRVYSLEIVPELARVAIRRIASLGLDNVKIQTFDGSLGWRQAAPFDRILVTAGAPTAPEPLLEQLKPGGRLVLPEGDRVEQRLIVYRRLKQGFQHRVEDSVAFVPLLGRHGWDSKG